MKLDEYIENREYYNEEFVGYCDYSEIINSFFVNCNLCN